MPVPPLCDPDPLRVRTPAFDGPLDLLLYLVRRDGIDLRSLPIAHITREYLAFLHRARELDLEVAGEFLVMAALLCELKSRLLLPRPDLPAEEPEEEDPAERLRQRLLEYERFRRAAEELDARPRLGRDVFARPAPARAEALRPLQAGMDAWGLVDTFFRLLERSQEAPPVHEVERESVSMPERAADLVARLGRRGRCTLAELLVEEPTRTSRIVTFLALLELARLGVVDLAQAEHLGPVEVWLAVPADRVDLSAIPMEA